MFPSYRFLKDQLTEALSDKMRQGHDGQALLDDLKSLPDSYDAIAEFAEKVRGLPLRADWPYVEPDEFDDIMAEAHSDRPRGQVGCITLSEAQSRVRTAFLGSVAGCILGKPLEFNPDLSTIRKGLESVGQWPMSDYISERALDAIGKRHWSWFETAREYIRYAAPDDDINYTIMGMLMLERYGLEFTKEQLRDAWLEHLPISTTFGPERLVLTRAGLASTRWSGSEDLDAWSALANPGNELCGAAIRADAYGYACPGRPDIAVQLAWRDASFTHRRTGVYSTMYIAAVIALAQVMEDRLAIFETALLFMPQRSRFREIVGDCIEMVRKAPDWLSGYEAINNKYSQYCHCQVYQEVGTLVNTLKFAEDVWHGVCIQVSQGNDTDSFGATSGSILGAYFGPSGLNASHLAVFNDDLHTGLAWFFERSLSKVADRMAVLPKLTLDLE